MASPIRNRKDLKTIISANQKKDDQMLSSMEKLKLTEESEAEMLRSRIDEQGQLICILKKRADEFMIRNQKLEKINEEIQKLRQHAIEETKDEAKRSEMLEQRFNELAANHEEMIKYKDEHKRRNKILTSENERLLCENRSLFSNIVTEKDAVIDDLRSSLQNAKKLHRQAMDERETKVNEMLEKNSELNGKVGSLENEIEQLHKKLNMTEKSLSKVKAERDIARSHNDSASQQLQKDNDLLLDQVMQRGKLLQERQSEVEQLEEQLKHKEDQLRASQETFQSMEDRVNVNARVKKLQVELEFAEEEMTQLKQEYDAYKAHSNKLLEQEKDLNFKLRKNIL